ncbi:T9SS type A sorting domain-containing protein [Maribacter arenosus]|uniref:T9SS type A sorting domain-containing protein n=1 Tax=Maribacter arenosus TaxID=1854708 RepID=A0ABR7VGM6_9FLAO|nr:T9SS type A sorting domain-containing protein [Maribacter arenosus]MBD0851533.1 T9SS type A sorting domain-containing protein [Maribacter arenosus]
MKKIYFILLMVSSIALFAQEPEHLANARNHDLPGFKLYPNPAFNDVVYITTDKNARKDIIVYDVFGEIVLTDRILNSSLNISRLIPGVYVLQVSENNNTITRKLVVK